MTKRPSKLRRSINVSSPCVVTTFAAGVPQATTVLPYTSRVDFEKEMNARGERILAKMPRAVVHQKRA